MTHTPLGRLYGAGVPLVAGIVVPVLDDYTAVTPTDVGEGLKAATGV